MAQTIFKSGIAERLRNLILPQPKIEEKYCRLCLASCDSQFKDLFSSFNPTQNIAEMIQDFAKVTITQEDDYSKVMCLICFIKLKDTENFKDVIVNSDFKLRNQKMNCEDPLEANPADEKFLVEEVDIKTEVCSDTEEDGKDETKTKSIKIEDCVKETEHTNSEKSLNIKKKRIKKPHNIKCTECDTVCKWRNDFKRHMISHTGIYPFYCSFCKKGFSRKYDKQIHEVIHTGERRYQCETCGKSSKSNSALLLHKKTHESVKPFKCNQCDKAFMSNQYLRMHIANIHSLKTEECNFTCNVCNRQYKTRFHLQNHMRNYHKPRKLGTCNICGKVVKQLNAHIKSHFKLHKCTICNQCFGTGQALKTHSVVHTGQRLYECDICKKRFGFSGTLYKHKKTHLANNGFKCQFCNRQFYYEFHWKVHLRKKHQYITS